MLDPSEIDFKKLPSVSIEDRRHLPESSCIYFAIDSQDEIQYIGMTVNVKRRWQQHHRFEEFEQIGGIRIVYLEVSEPAILPAIESALIDHFSPFLNRLTADSCPIALCTGKLHSKGKNRSHICNTCGYRESSQRGRPRKHPDRLVTDRDVYLAKKQGANRQVTYALFDPMLVPEGAIGVIHEAAFVGLTIGCSRQRVEIDHPGLTAIPFGSIGSREKRWMR